MKTTIQLLAIFLGILLLTSFKTNTSEQPPMYYIAVGWEEPASGNNSPQPVVTNVVYMNCKYHSENQVVNQLFDYYNAYYKKNRNTLHLKQRITWGYNTSDEAEKKRRELIAGYINQGWDPLLIYNFSVLCDDK